MIGTEAPLADRRLWQSVILQAVADATGNGKDNRARREKAEARAWLLYGDDDFRDVCANAGLCPDTVRREAERYIAEADAKPPRIIAAPRRREGYAGSGRGRKPSVFVEHDGLKLSLKEWSGRVGVPYATIIARRNRGLSTAEILAPSARRGGSRRMEGAGGGKQLSSNAGETGAPVTRKIASK